MSIKDDVRRKILEHMRVSGLELGHYFGLADAHANVMKELFPSEEGIPQRTFSPRALFDEALDELVAEGFVEKRIDGRYYLTERGRAGDGGAQ
jgi:hypothetical protein